MPLIEVRDYNKVIYVNKKPLNSNLLLQKSKFAKYACLSSAFCFMLVAVENQYQ